MIRKQYKDVPYYIFEKLEKTGLVRQAFSTRLGGVTNIPGKEYLSSMNLGFNRGDDDENVKKNFAKMAEVLGVSSEQLVMSKQTHTTNVKVVDITNAGNGITKENEFEDVDGIITNDPNIVLVTTYADCVPLYFLDPVKRVIALSHSGWRGTVGMIGLNTVNTMKKEFGCDPKDIIGCIGPSICQNCYEVSFDVADEFIRAFGEEHKDELLYQKDEQKKDNKWQLNLWKANELVMLKAGLLEENIEVGNECTCCQSEVFYSHRASHGMRGALCAFLGLSS